MKYRECLVNVAPYVPGKNEEEIKKEFGLEKVVKIASNENPYGPTPNIKEYLNGVNFSIYPDNYMSELRSKLSNRLNVNEEKLLFGNGSVEIIQMISRAFLNNGDNIVTQLPSFSSYFSEAKIQDAEIRTIKYNDKYSFNLDEMLKLIDAKTKIVYITNPNNPLGTIVTKEELYNFVSKVPSNILVVIDEAYFEFVRDEKYASGIELMDEFKNVCILRTFSKAYALAALRIGYIVASEEIITNLEKVRVPFNASTIAQKCACIALDDEKYMKDSVGLIYKTIDYIYERLDKLNIEYIKTQANFIMINVKQPSKDVVFKLMKNGFIVRDGFPLMENWIRVSIGTLQDMEEFLKVLSEVI